MSLFQPSIINKFLPFLSDTAEQKIKLHNTTLLLIRKDFAAYSSNVRHTYSTAKKHNP